MPDQPEGPTPTRAGALRAGTLRAAGARATRATYLAFRQLGGGLGTAVLALGVLLWLLITALTSLIGVGLVVVPTALWALHAVADRERARLSRWGPEVAAPGPLPTRIRPALADPSTRRELYWLAGHATWGLLLGLIGVLLPLSAVRDLSFPLWWRFVPEGQAAPTLALWTVWDWPGAFAVALLGLGWFAIAVGLNPAMARLQAGRGRRLLTPGPDLDLSLRVAQLTATRAAALDAHAVELRRIERALHDGTQNRLVAVTVLLGAARRMVARDPTSADELLERAQSAAEEALSELRAVGRGILPPVLEDRGLAGALTGLAANCPVPCQVDAEVPERCAAAVEATVYFIVAEALTNVAKHSQAHQATVLIRSRAGRLHVRISDDGLGGADENRGSGLTGMRRRIEAHDGHLTLTSPPGGPTTLELDVPCGS
jgi:signal transduction histidine kinase